jgi:hypothetical protein
VARLVPFGGAQRRVFGLDKGKIEVPEDFDAPLPPHVLKAFEG